MNEVIRLFQGKVLRNHQLSIGDIWIKNGVIVEPQEHAHIHIDAFGMIVAPGFIDLQINGGYGHDFTSDPSSVDTVAAQLPHTGVTAFLPTIVSSDCKSYHKNLPKIPIGFHNPFFAEVLGIHLEGPFINEQFSGAHSKHLCRVPQHGIHDVLSCYGTLDHVKMITLAPELPRGIDLIRQLTERNIVVSCGHSAATYEEMQEAVEAGLKMVTHLFNVMTPFHHRNPGVVGFALTDDRINFSLISDGHHLDETALKMAWKMAADRIILVTDAVSLFGSSYGTYSLGGLTIHKSAENFSVLEDSNTLAGSIVGMDAAVRHFHKVTGCPLVDALEVASYRPAKLLGIESRKGTLDVGADADILLLDEELNLRSCYVRGACAWKKMKDII